MVHPEVEFSWQKGELLSVADRGHYLLLEMPHGLFVDLRDIVRNLRRSGVRSILAHPERHPELLHEPGRIALAPDGTLLVLSGTRNDKAPQVEHYTAAGKRIDETFTLPADTVAVDITLDAQGRVLIADNGPRQQVLFFSKNNGRYAESGSLGERGGIFSGTPGKPGPQRFNGLTGVGVDARGNVYVSTNGIGPRYDPIGAGLGATLESYAPDGKQNWQVQGLLFVDGAWIDPSRPDSVYTGNKRFELDLSKRFECGIALRLGQLLMQHRD